MNAWDYEAVAYEHEIYCIDCLPSDVNMQSGDVIPIFASSEWDAYPVCCACGREYNYAGLLESDNE